MNRAATLCAHIARMRLPLGDEKLTQAALAEGLDALGIAHEREAVLSNGRVDFLIEGRVAIEVKLRSSSKAEIYRQVRRYAEDDRVESIILVSNTAMRLPETIERKPAYVVSLGMAWL